MQIKDVTEIIDTLCPTEDDKLLLVSTILTRQAKSTKLTDILRYYEEWLERFSK